MKLKAIQALTLLILVPMIFLCAVAEESAPVTPTADAPVEVIVPDIELDNDACFDAYVGSLFGMEPRFLTAKTRKKPQKACK